MHHLHKNSLESKEIFQVYQTVLSEIWIYIYRKKKSSNISTLKEIYIAENILEKNKRRP